MVENQYSYVLDALGQIEANDLASVDVRIDAQDRFIAELDRKMETTVWMQGGCSSWYVDDEGRNSTLWPDWTFEHERQTRSFDLSEYEVEPPSRASSRTSSPRPDPRGRCRPRSRIGRLGAASGSSPPPLSTAADLSRGSRET